MAKKEIRINLGDGVNLVAEQGTDSGFAREIYLGIVNDNGVWLQDLAIVRQKYELPSGNDDEAKYVKGQYQVLVYADETTEDYTNVFNIAEAECDA